MSFGAKVKESFRKKIVSLKRKPSTIPMVALCITFVYFSLNLTNMSNTTAKIQAAGMGLSQFGIMLFSLLSLVCMMNSFPRRKKANVPMVVLLFLMIAIIIYCDTHYLGCISRNVGGENGLEITSNTMYIIRAQTMLHVHIILEAISAALVATLPLYSKLIRSIRTSVNVEDNGSMDALELED